MPLLRRKVDPRVLTGAALLLDTPERVRLSLTQHEQWQQRAWEFYDSGGELRYAATWVANAMSKVRLMAAELPDSQGDPPTTIEDGPAAEAVSAFAGGVVGQSQLLSTVAVHLSIPGLGYIVGEQPEDEPERRWYAVSADEIKRSSASRVLPDGTSVDVVEVQDEDGVWRELPDEHLIVKVWRAHKRVRKNPDSPVRPLLDTLGEIEILSSVVRAQGTSRLAGAGLLLVPSEADWEAPPSLLSPVEGEGPTEAEPEERSFYTDLINAMMTPLRDRSSPASVVPLLAEMPGEFLDKVKHVRFDSPLDDKVLALREAAIRRLSLGLEVPPEILLGMGDVNHWSAWEISESALSFHIEPLAELICDALTEGFLQPTLRSQGVTDPSNFVVWYSTDDLRVRPDRSGSAKDLYDRMQLSADALRRESGFTDEDAPADAELMQNLLVAAFLASPTTVELLPAIFPGEDWEAIIEAAKPEPPPALGPAPPPPEAPAEGPPEREAPVPPEDESEPAQGATAASGAVLELVPDVIVAACEGVVVDALRRATTRIANIAARGRPGGPSTVTCDSGPLWRCFSVAPSELSGLFEGAWARVPELAARYELHEDALLAALDSYCRMIVASGAEHDIDCLAAALGR